MKKLLLITAMVTTGGIAGTAFAADTNTVNFDGQRAVECDLTGTDNVLFGALGRRGQAAVVNDTGVSVFCNQPSDVSFESQNGYLKLVTGNSANDSVSETDFTSGANPGFAAGLDWSATVPSMGGLTANTSVLTAGSPAVVSSVPAMNISNFTIKYDTVDSSQPLLGGNYQDILTIILTPLGV